MAADIVKRIERLERQLAPPEIEEDVRIMRYTGDYSRDGGGEKDAVLSAITLAGKVNGPLGFTLNRLEGESETDFLQRFETVCGQSLNMS